MDRRHFLQAIGATVAGATLGGLARRCLSAAESLDDMPIVDTHQHLWDLRKFKLDWLADAPEVLRRTYLTKDYLEAAAGLNVTKCVYMEVDLVVEQQPAEADYVIELSKSSSHPTVAGVISGRCDSPQFAGYIKRYQGSPYIKGVRHLLQGAPRGLCLKPQFVKSVQLLGTLEMSFDITMRPTELSDGLRLIKQCPDTRFIVDHCGTADPKAFLPGDGKRSHEPETWKRDMANLAKQDHVICKISGIVAHAPQGWQTAHLVPIVDHCLDTFGPERVVFGSDWPVCLLGATYQQWVTALKEIVRDRPLPQQQQLFYKNAERHYRLTPPDR